MTIPLLPSLSVSVCCCGVFLVKELISNYLCMMLKYYYHPPSVVRVTSLKTAAAADTMILDQHVSYTCAACYPHFTATHLPPQATTRSRLPMNDLAVQVYCDMKGTHCGGEGGCSWMRVAYFNMTDSSSQCPVGFRVDETATNTGFCIEKLAVLGVISCCLNQQINVLASVWIYGRGCS